MWLLSRGCKSRGAEEVVVRMVLRLLTRAVYSQKVGGLIGRMEWLEWVNSKL